MPTAAPLDTEDEAEDVAIAAGSGTPEQRALRAAWANERHDEPWTRAIRDEVKATAESLLAGELEMEELSCRETVCRMHLQFADERDAELFIAAPRDPALRYAFYGMNGEHPVADLERPAPAYELMIARMRPGPVPSPAAHPLPAESGERRAVPYGEVSTFNSNAALEAGGL